MAFHVACPITCRRICFCALGFPPALHAPIPNNAFLHFVAELREFIAYSHRATTVQVVVPKVVPPPPPPDGVPAGADAPDEVASMHAKRLALQRKGAVAMIAAEEHARRFESLDVADTSGNLTGEEQSQSSVKLFCRMCNRVEDEGSQRAKKMLSCRSCSKKYHRSCLRSWAQHRDLFHWSSWTCRACRICEACRRTGDPSKLMFCKRCDGAYHCYCLQPPHKNVSSGPYLCPKHTRCHSCGSNVPGNGLSLRWFLGYTCCDACGRLFVKGNYCPVCLKVYRDSEPTPMVCCDICQRWVHPQCDNISDEKYLQFQVDGNMQYKCPMCRGECYQVKDLDDARQELWRRRDIAERNLIASLRAAAGLPTQEEIFSISPYSDDDDSGPFKLKGDSGRSFKLSLKSFSNNSPKKKPSSKKTAKKDSQLFMTGKTDACHSFEGNNDGKSLHSLDHDKNDDIQSQRNEATDVYSSPAAGSLSQSEVSFPVNQPGILAHKFVDEVMVSDEERKPRVVRIKNNKAHTMDSEEESGKRFDMTQNMKGKKLVINLGARKINVASSLGPDTSSCQRDQDLIASNGNSVDSGKSEVFKVSGGEGNLIKLGKVKPEVSKFNLTFGSGNSSDGCEVIPLERACILEEKYCNDEMIDQVGPVRATPRIERTYMRKQSERSSNAFNEINDNNNPMPSHSLPKDSKPLLRFKFKRPFIGNQSSAHQDKAAIKGQRSKRKRPSSFKEKTSFDEVDGVIQSREDNLMDEIMGANWILMKLGKDAIGKRVEVHQTSDNSWHKGVVTDVVDGTSKLYVTFDDGKVKFLELRKQGVRFIPQKRKRSKH